MYVYLVCQCTRNMLCFKSNKTLYACDATVLFNVYIYLVFVGKGCLALVPLHLPHLRRLCLEYFGRGVHEYVEKLVAALPELEVKQLLW